MEVNRHEPRYLAADSEVVERIGERQIGDLVALAFVSLRDIKEDWGEDVADELVELGNEITTMVNDTIRRCAGGIPAIADKAMVYLTSVASANVAVAIFTALDEIRFEMELEEYQKSGGIE